MLTVSAMSINEPDQARGLLYKFLFMMDMPNQDLLGDSLLEEALAFVEKAVKDKANIIVHW